MNEKDKAQGLVICPINVRTKTEHCLVEIAESLDTLENTKGDPIRHFLVLTPGSLRIKRRISKSSVKKSVVKDRSAITSWSRKSRANMVSRFSSLDLAPLYVNGENALAAMITLTYPKDWLELVPTASQAKKHLQQFRKRYERRFNQPLFAMWKAEFQRRGAVHFHLFTASPVPLAEFRRWVAETWSQIVNPPSASERLKHLRAGTAVDLAPGITIQDARLVAVYFSKHSSPNLGAKDYQNKPPQAWIDAGSVGRFWGYWNLKPLEVEAAITESEAIAASRLLRRWYKAKRFTRIERVCRINRQGTIKFRNVRRRSVRFSGNYGFLALKDSIEISRDLSRYLSLIRGTSNATISAQEQMSQPADSLRQ
jgi:hypothetical protein